MSVQGNKKHMDLNSLKLYKPLKIKETMLGQCVSGLLTISLSWFLNRVGVKKHCNYLLNLKTTENTVQKETRDVCL